MHGGAQAHTAGPGLGAPLSWGLTASPGTSVNNETLTTGAPAIMDQESTFKPNEELLENTFPTVLKDWGYYKLPEKQEAGPRQFSK